MTWTVPAVRPGTSLSLTEVNCCASSCAAARSAALPYSITDFLYVIAGASAGAEHVKPRLVSAAAAVARAIGRLDPSMTMTLTCDGAIVSGWPALAAGLADGLALAAGLRWDWQCPPG